jgi:hypothetical protein
MVSTDEHGNVVVVPTNAILTESDRREVMNILTENTVTEENFECDPIVSIATTVTGDIGQVITIPTEAANTDDLDQIVIKPIEVTAEANFEHVITIPSDSPVIEGDVEQVITIATVDAKTKGITSECDHEQVVSSLMKGTTEGDLGQILTIPSTGICGIYEGEQAELDPQLLTVLSQNGSEM